MGTLPLNGKFDPDKLDILGQAPKKADVVVSLLRHNL